MPYDVAFRHQQALDPSALTTVAGTLHAIEAAIRDCRNAGVDIEIDPAVTLLARHLASVCANRGDDAILRRRCLDAVAELRRHPALITLALRGVAYDEAAKALFHADGRRALRRLADALGLAEADYEIRSNKGGVAVSGEITLHGEAVWVSLGLGALGADHEVCFRGVRGRRDHHGDRNHWASIRELLAPDRFAARIRRELALAPATAEQDRLFA
jgi:hypothetical protein